MAFTEELLNKTTTVLCSIVVIDCTAGQYKNNGIKYFLMKCRWS